MAVFNVTEALSYLGRTVLVDTYCHEDGESIRSLVNVVGVVIPVAGVYEHPHFMVINVSEPQSYPDELFWDRIIFIRPMANRGRRSDSVQNDGAHG